MSASDLINELLSVGSSTLHEAMGRQGALRSCIRPICAGQEIAGPAITVQCHPADNLTLLHALDVASAGDVLVVSTGEYLEAGYFGEVMATACMARQIAGLVIDGGVRDVARLRELGFPVFASNLCMRGTVKKTLGEINQPLLVRDQLVMPGDLVRGDGDGVVIVPHARAKDIAVLSAEREEDEERKMAMLKHGSSLPELLGLKGIG